MAIIVEPAQNVEECFDMAGRLESTTADVASLRVEIAALRAELAAARAEIARHKTVTAAPEDVSAAIYALVEAAKQLGFDRGSGADCAGSLAAMDAAGAALRVAMDAATIRASPPTDTPAPCAHLDRVLDGSCFGCGRGEDNPNPEDTP